MSVLAAGAGVWIRAVVVPGRPAFRGLSSCLDVAGHREVHVSAVALRRGGHGMLAVLGDLVQAMKRAKASATGMSGRSPAASSKLIHRYIAS